MIVTTELEWQLRELLEVERLKTLLNLEENTLILWNLEECDEDTEEEI